MKGLKLHFLAPNGALVFNTLIAFFESNVLMLKSNRETKRMMSEMSNILCYCLQLF